MSVNTFAFRPAFGLSPASQRVKVPVASASSVSIQHVDLVGAILPDFRVRHTFPVSLVRDDDGSYIASDPVFLVYGTGSTPFEAIDDFVVALKEYYDIVAEQAADNPEDSKLLAQLNVHFQRL